LSNRNANGKTALLDICRFGDWRILKYFLPNASNADIYTGDLEGNTPLSEAFSKHNAKIILLLYTIDMHERRLTDLLSFSPDYDNALSRVLFEACISGNLELVDTLYPRLIFRMVHKDGS
jgi:ankyrin repeat protein